MSQTYCSHCDLNSQAFKYPLAETKNFYIVCDAHPIVEGHILIIPKRHISCVGNYPQDLFADFLKLYRKVSEFERKGYKTISTFEHGVFGQTVFHSHIHFLPFKGSHSEIVSEGTDKLLKLKDLTLLKSLYNKSNGYLFFSIKDSLWSVDINLASPGFFRDRFAIALGRPERGNWKSMSNNKDIMEQAAEENLNTRKKWQKFYRAIRKL